ncbi:MAG: alpha/beta fold hydrolase [Candidatus Moranbacteria bacterium]|nr:alpha/beta fold hydrolase [Candidatus Moranbacteria bacterium]
MAQKGISPEEKRFINEVIAPQLQKTSRIKITFGWQNFMIDYCIINNGQSAHFKGIIVLLQGFGSGWRGIAMLGMHLAKLDYEVCMLSLPGCGNSSDPNHFIYHETDCFFCEETILARFVKEVLPDTEIHFVGHSMGAKIITDLACSNPDLVATLTLLAPAGFEKRNRWEVLAKFALNGLGHALAFRKNAVWTELEKVLPREKSAFMKQRRSQRVVEWKKLCQGSDAKKIVRQIPEHISINCIWGEKDSVFPMRKSSLTETSRARRYFEAVELPLWHNMTMFGSHETAAAIDDLIHEHHERAKWCP